MRLALTIAALALMIASPAWTATSSDDEAMANPCRTYLASSGSAIYGALIDAISNRLGASPNASRFGSTCNMGDFVSAECKAHPGDDVRRALERLERAGAAGRLPHIPCAGLNPSRVPWRSDGTATPIASPREISMLNPYICPIWKVKAEVTSGQGDYIEVVSSQIPGRYRLTGSAKPIVETLGDREKARVTTWIVDQHALGELIPMLTSEVIDQACERPPMSILQRCDRLLMAVVECCPGIGEEFLVSGAQTPPILNRKSYARAWSECLDDKELHGLLRIVADNGFMRANNLGYVMDLKGLVHLEEMRKNRTASTQAFVAMWFDMSMRNAYETGIKLAIQNVGYVPMRIDNKEHSNKIDDEIIAEIRRSKFVVADFTSEKHKPRGGVYYEAGFAMGLGLPVIWTCRADLIDSVHFDTRQFNHITWDAPDDLRVKLEKRIGAVVGDGPIPRPVAQ